MYLLDSNIVLELLLDQDQADEVERFLRTVPRESLHISEFSLCSVGIVLFRRQKFEAFGRLLNDLVGTGGVRVLRLSTRDLEDLAAALKLLPMGSKAPAWPRITVVTPSYNQGRFLEACIRSVLDQGYPNLEYIIIDGGSTDGSVAIIRRYEEHLAHWVSEPDRGQAHAINKGFHKATGEIFTWLNSDDLYELGALQAVGQTFAQNPEAQVLCGTCLLVDEAGRPIGRKRPRSLKPEHFLQGGSVPGQPAVFFRRGVWERVGGLDEGLHYVLDWEFWLRVSLRYPPEAVVPLERVLARARIWPQAKSSRAGARGIEERQQVLERLFADARLPAPLRRLRSRAYSDLQWRWALLRWGEGRYLSALRHLGQAAWRDPRPAVQGRRLRRLAWAVWHRRPVL